MPREPKHNVEDQVEENKENPTNEEAALWRKGDYYYDDAHGYQDYDPEKQREDDEFDD